MLLLQGSKPEILSEVEVGEKGEEESSSESTVSDHSGGVSSSTARH